MQSLIKDIDASVKNTEDIFNNEMKSLMDEQKKVAEFYSSM